MFIYILSQDCEYASDIEDAVVLATTDFQQVLDYFTLNKIRRFNDYQICFCKDGNVNTHSSINIGMTMSDNLREHPPTILYKDKDALNKVIEISDKWINTLKIEMEDERRKAEEEKKRKQMIKDKALYEKLKKQFEKEDDNEISL